MLFGVIDATCTNVGYEQGGRFSTYCVTDAVDFVAHRCQKVQGHVDSPQCLKFCNKLRELYIAELPMRRNGFLMVSGSVLTTHGQAKWH